MSSYEKYGKPRREWLKQHGICVSCGQKSAVANTFQCEDCLYKSQLNNIKYRNLEKERKYYPKRKEKRKERKNKGLCVQCGKKATNGVLCLECYTRRKTKREEAKHENQHRIWKDSGLCYRCGSPLYKHHKLCKECYDKSVTSIKIARTNNKYFKELNKAFWEENKYGRTNK